MKLADIVVNVKPLNVPLTEAHLRASILYSYAEASARYSYNVGKPVELAVLDVAQVLGSGAYEKKEFENWDVIEKIAIEILDTVYNKGV